MATADTEGLSSQQAAERLRQEGPNLLVRDEGRGPFRILLDQLESPLIWLLIAAAVISGVLGEWIDSIAISAIVVLNAAVGFFQEYRAERAVLALRSMTAPRAQVLRDGHAQVIPAADVVVGDVLLLSEGDLVAADARLLEANRLSANEAALTGESLPVEKSTRPTRDDAPLAERTDRVFMGTAIPGGSGRALVTATGMRTEIGRIAALLSTAREEQTPLQKRLEVLGRTLLIVCVGVVALVVVLGLVRGEHWQALLIPAIALAVAVVPEGLPAVVTVALAVGVQRMARRHVLVRKLSAVETLGTTTTICTDKTGTLTTGKMRVREVWGPDPKAVLYAATACSDAELTEGSEDGVGDPTELAILIAAREQAIQRSDVERDNARVTVNPFDSDRKRMSIQRKDGVLYVKGAVDLLLPLCRKAPDGALEANARMAAQGLRVLGVAVGRGDQEQDLELLGLIGMADPPRPEAIEAVANARAAGIRTVMITGDHPVTAHAIARELGIVIEEEDPKHRVHARVTAAEKLHIVRELKSRGEVVAMTGDGVNDAPALREAHIGIAMGRTGTEVTREASDMVLSDDNYASIVAAVREGRTIFDNIRNTLVYLLAGNTGELLIVFAASLAGMPLPLLPVQLLYVNLITDGLPALALVVEPSGRDVLASPPRKLDEPLLARTQWLRILFTGALEATVVFGTYVWFLDREGVDVARTMAFSTLVFAELFRAFAARSPTRVFWELGPFTNLALLMVVAVSAGLLVVLHEVPLLRQVFGLVDTEVEVHLLEAATLALIPVTLLELTKLFIRLIRRLKAPARP